MKNPERLYCSLLTVLTLRPKAPLNLVASNETATTVDLSWDAINIMGDVQEYIIYQDGVEIARTTHPTTTYQATGLTSATTYVFEVSAITADMVEGEKASVEATTI